MSQKTLRARVPVPFLGHLVNYPDTTPLYYLSKKERQYRKTLECRCNECKKSQSSLLASELALVVTDDLHLRGGGAARVEAVRQPLGSELLSQFDTDDTLAEAEHLSVVALDRALNAERIVGGHGADTGHLVRGDGDAQAGTTNEKGAVGLAILDELGGLDSNVWVGGFVSGGGYADVCDGFDQRAG